MNDTRKQTCKENEQVLTTHVHGGAALHASHSLLAHHAPADKLAWASAEGRSTGRLAAIVNSQTRQVWRRHGQAAVVLPKPPTPTLVKVHQALWAARPVPQTVGTVVKGHVAWGFTSIAVRAMAQLSQAVGLQILTHAVGSKVEISKPLGPLTHVAQTVRPLVEGRRVVKTVQVELRAREGAVALSPAATRDRRRLAASWRGRAVVPRVHTVNVRQRPLEGRQVGGRTGNT